MKTATDFIIDTRKRDLNDIMKTTVSNMTETARQMILLANIMIDTHTDTENAKLINARAMELSGAASMLSDWHDHIFPKETAENGNI